MSESKTYVNADTYQTLKELKVAPQPYEKNITPLWKPATGQVKLGTGEGSLLCVCCNSGT
jgi:ABC-type cobalt transport system substrate-binding protein